MNFEKGRTKTWTKQLLSNPFLMSRTVRRGPDHVRLYRVGGPVKTFWIYLADLDTTRGLAS